MKNAPATFQRMMNRLIPFESWQEHLDSTDALYNRLTEAKLTVNLSKSQIGKAKVIFLGHVIGQGEVSPVSVKIDSIANFPQPITKKELM